MKTARPPRRPATTSDPFDVQVRNALLSFRRKSTSRQKALLIKWDILNPDGTLRQYPMDHVPYGPRG